MKTSKNLLYILSLTILIAACGGGGSPPAPLAPSPPPLSNDSGATDIVLSNVTLDQIFQTTLLNYTATVPASNPTTTVTASLSDANATMTVNGKALGTGVESEKITLNQGSSNTNIITVLVTAEDGVNTTTYTFDVTRQSLANFAQRAYIKASNTDPNDWFGHSVAFDGDTLVVGAPREGSRATGIDGDQADNSAGRSGAVYVFTRDPSGVWTQQAYIKASNTEPSSDSFGYSVALDGDTLVVGAPFEDSNATGIDGDQADNSANQSGAVYVFTRDASGVWTQQAYIKASNTQVPEWCINEDEGNELQICVGEDFFGWSVALDGDTLAIGANGEDSSATGVEGDQADNSAEDAGAVYVFTRDASDVWSQQAYIKASNTDPHDWFGYSVALAGDTLAVGAHQEASNGTGVDGDQADNHGKQIGAVYVFTRDPSGVWSQQAYIKSSNAGNGDRFGRSVILDGDTLAVGAHNEDSNATGVDGDQANNHAQNSGAVYVFTRDASDVWTQQAYIKASTTDVLETCFDEDEENNPNICDQIDLFGFSVALDGDTLVVGALLEDSSATGVDGDQTDNSAERAGAVYMFTRDASDVWSQQAYIKASNAEAGDSFGFSVAVDGDTLAVGAIEEASSATGVEGDQADNSAERAGAVYVFE